MNFFSKRVSVKPNHIGYLYKKNRFRKVLEPNIYYFFDPNSEIEVISLPTTTKLLNVLNQEVLTQDNIALRLSYIVEYRISDGRQFLSTFDVQGHHPLQEAEQLIHNLTQVYLRGTVSTINSEALNEQRNEIFATIPTQLRDRLHNSGIELQQILLRDISFPKMIQDLFARQLEAKIRAKADLENARTTVATARALKNAADLVKDNDNIKFFKFLETLTKISANGKHTFVIGDLNNGAIKHNGADNSSS